MFDTFEKENMYHIIMKGYVLARKDGKKSLS
jgi:hypothetical protein